MASLPCPLPELRTDDGMQRGRAIGILVDGDPVMAHEGESVAVALLASGRRIVRTTQRRGAPRGLYCSIGVCFECVMVIDGRPGVRTCQTPVREGMRIQTQTGEGSWTFAAASKSLPAASSPTPTGLPPPDPETSCGCGT